MSQGCQELVELRAQWGSGRDYNQHDFRYTDMCTKQSDEQGGHKNITKKVCAKCKLSECIHNCNSGLIYIMAKIFRADCELTFQFGIK